MILVPIIVGFLLICLAIMSYVKRWHENGETAFLIGLVGGIILVIGCLTILDKENPSKEKKEIGVQLQIESKVSPEALENKLLL